VVATDLTDNPVIAGVVLNARDVTDRVEATAALAAKAYTDALTGLPNRVRILDRMGSWLQGAEPTPALVLLVDFDRMTSINETFGRAVGDDVLRTVAGRLRANVGDTAMVGRLGSDEFVVVVPGLTDAAEGANIAQRLRAAAAVPIDLPDGSVQLTASIGVAVARVGDEPDDLLLDAGRAMAHAKESGRDRVEVFNESLAVAATRRRTVEQQLRRALDNDGLCVHYQPIVDIESGAVVSAEALLRVHGDDGALLSPAEFIEAAESTGLIARLGSQVLQLTGEQLAAWIAEAGQAAPPEISVNISPRQLADPELPTKVVEAMASAGVEPQRLCLEITESILIGAQPVVDAGISYLREVGVRIGLDDFGTGQSSLGYLKRFPLDFVKIDKSLIAGLGTNEHDTAIVRATIELAHNLGLQVVAVGVEFDEQLDALSILGCDRAQGYFFAPPLPADQFVTEVAERLR
jgi:diguanylate cyclase (GGDEF)-like protein